MTKYAENTSVPIDKSKSEIEATLRRYGATAFMYSWSGNRAVIGFDISNRRYRIELPLPDKNDFRRTETGRMRSNPDTIYTAWEQGTRQRWRALTLVIKAILEGVESGILTVEDMLRNYEVLPNGRTVGEWIAPQIENVYKTGQMPPLLPGGETDNEDENIIEGEYR